MKYVIEASWFREPSIGIQIGWGYKCGFSFAFALPWIVIICINREDQS